jgi:sugar lactone lactonase YvrE
MNAHRSSRSDLGSVTAMTARRQGAGGITRAAAFLGVATLAALAPACGGSGATLEVEVVAPEGVVPDVTVNGPGSYFVTIHETTTLRDVPPGDYSIRVVDRRARVSQPTVDTIYAATVTGTPATLAETATASVSVRFDREPGSGRVWIPAAEGDRVVSYTGDELDSAGAPSVELQFASESVPSAVAVDARGNLWVSLAGAGKVVRIAATELGATHAPEPTATIAVEAPQSIAIGEGGDLWIASAAARTLSRWGNALEAPSRRTDISVDGVPRGIAFDKQGRMFVTTSEPPALLVYTAEALTTPKPSPAKSILGAPTRLVDPRAVAIDGRSGAVWVTDAESGEAMRFDGAAIDGVVGQAALAPSAVLSEPSAGDRLHGFAFDNAGQAWFSTSAEGGTLALVKAVDMQQTPAFGGSRPLFDGSPRRQALGVPAFVPPSRMSPIRR